MVRTEQASAYGRAANCSSSAGAVCSALTVICCAFQIRSSQLPQALPPCELALGFFSGGYYPLDLFYSFQCTFCAFQVLKFDFVWIAVYSCIENSIGIKMHMCRKAPLAHMPCRRSWRFLVSSGGVCTTTKCVVSVLPPPCSRPHQAARAHCPVPCLVLLFKFRCRLHSAKHTDEFLHMYSAMYTTTQMKSQRSRPQKVVFVPSPATALPPRSSCAHLSS